MRRLAAVLACLAALFGAGLALATSAQAHATVVTSDPRDGSRLARAPQTVTITFDESVGISGVGYLHVTDQTGRRVDAGAAFHPGGDATKVADRLVSGLRDSTYTASFRVVSADSHPVAGTIRFVVGNGPLARGSVGSSSANSLTSALLDAARWVSFAGFAGLGGVWLLLTLWPDGRGERRARRVVWTGWSVLVAGTALELVLEGPYASGGGPGGLAHWSLLDGTLRASYGVLHSVRLVLLGVVALALARALRTDAHRERWEAALPLLGVALAYSFSATGHADTTSPTWLSIAADTAHLLAMAAWIGGLAMLVLAVLPSGSGGTVVQRFSPVALTCVVVLAVTGTYAAWRGIGSLDAILGTDYGLLITGKVVLFLALVALGYLARRSLRRPDDAVERERLRRGVLVEAGIGALVLALTAVLVAEPRGNEALAAQYREPVSVSTPLGVGRTVTVRSDPGVHGSVSLTVQVSGGAQPKTVTATATEKQRQIGPIPVPLRHETRGIYDATVDLPTAGSWTIDLVVTTSQFDATTASVVLSLH